jgi:hypothetical protein
MEEQLVDKTIRQEIRNKVRLFTINPFCPQLAIEYSEIEAYGF